MSVPLWRVVLGLFLIAAVQSPEEIEQGALAALRQLRHQEALAAFDKLLSLDPDRASAHYGKGLALSGLLDYGGAVSSLERAVAIDRTHAPAYRQLAILYAQLGQRVRSRIALEEARSLAGVPAQERLPFARALRKAGLLGEARAVLKEAGEESHSVGLSLELGLLAMERGNYGQAREHLSVAAADPSTSPAEADYEYARCLEILDEPQRAMELYRRVLEKAPHHRQARFRLGSLLLRSGQEEEGKALLRGYERVRQWDRRVKLLLAMISSGTLFAEERKLKTLQAIELLIEGEAYSAAERLIQSGLASYPEEPLFHVLQAKAMVTAGKFEQANQTLARLVSQASAPAEAFWVSGQLYLRQGRLSDALEAYVASMERLAEPPARLLQELATVYAITGRTEEAKKNFEKAIDKDPLLADAHADLGLLLESEGRLAEAESRYRRALEINPDLVSAQQGLASLLLQKGKTDGAAELFRQSVRLRPEDPLLRRNLALALEKLGRRDEARAEREKARQLEVGKKPYRR